MGGGILLVKNRSLPQLVARVYPDFNWNISQFSQNYDIWTDENLANYFMSWLQKQPESDVYDVHKIIKSMAIKGDFPLALMLKNTFPNLYWPTTISAKGKKSQSMLKESLEKIFTDKDTVLLEEYKHPDFMLANNYLLELDLFYPQFNLAFEFQVSKINKGRKLKKQRGNNILDMLVCLINKLVIKTLNSVII